ncbi:MAG: penicillin acylase family protein [Colwellia sp.]|nr:penicillin acylase family protein [Colwellia sp.]
MLQNRLWIIKSYVSFFLLCLMSHAWAVDTSGSFKADIRWTEYGIPHISAKDEHGLGYGIGYSYALDNACLLIDEILTARGERSRYLGAKGESSAKLNNLTSDFFHTWLNSPQEVDVFWQAQPKTIQQLLQGYAAGFNRFLHEADSKTMSCFDEPWLNDITYKDLVRLTRRLLVEAGAGQFAESVVGAKPPQSWWQWLINKVANVSADNIEQTVAQTPWQGELQFGMGSNAVAIGGNKTANGKGMLLANPHFPWSGALRLYQMHLTIPGKLDVMGAALPGLPLINIGFNQHVAWTHTVDSSKHFTIYRLDLDPDDATRYLVDGKSYPLDKQTLKIQVRDDNGNMSTATHDLYTSKFGPLITWPGFMDWDEDQAYALRDANLANTRVLTQWYAINQAKDALEIRDSVEDIQGIPWVNTVATDDKGHALYMNQSVVPHLLTKQLKSCQIPALFAEGLPGLKGNTSACHWYVDASAAQAGITPSSKMPTLLRNDYVQNSNDSAWLTNPRTKLEGYSPLVSRQGNKLKLRTRFALKRLQGSDIFTADFIERMVTDNKVYLADLVLDDLLTFCSQQKGDSLAHACLHLKRWDGQANINSGLGLLYFDSFMEYFHDANQAWRVPFDAKDPVNTPRGIALNNSSVVDGIKEALNEGREKIEAWRLADDTRWGNIQQIVRGGEKISLPGGYGDLGIYNVLETQDQGDAKPEQVEVEKGSTYIQLVTFNSEGPQVKGLLASSQSSEVTSPYYSDQTKLFSQQYWPIIPFTEEQIKKASVIKQKRLLLP